MRHYSDTYKLKIYEVYQTHQPVEETMRYD